MNKLRAALAMTAFAIGSGPALADDLDMRPLTEMVTGHEVLAARLLAKAHWSCMTPDEQAAAKEAVRRKDPGKWTAVDEYAFAQRGFDEQFEDVHRQDREGSTKKRRKEPPAAPR